MKEPKTIIAILISLVVVIVAFYIRVTPPPETEETNNIPIEELTSSTSPTSPQDVPPAPGNTITPPVNGSVSGPQ